MCLLIVLFQVVPGVPLIVAANRDERLDRPAVAMTVLRAAGPRVLGGRDLLAGGTWLAVAERGLVAGLTNKPSSEGRDPSRRSRGELPLTCAGHGSAAQAAAAMSAEVDPRDYNPCWMLVGDQDSLFSVDVSGGTSTAIEELGPGVHVLENAPLGARSAKAALVRDLVGRALAGGTRDTAAALQAVLRSHQPAEPGPVASGPGAGACGRVRPAALSAPCVHLDGQGYGTRSSAIVTVPEAEPPAVLVADGPPCQAPMDDVTRLWQQAEPAPGRRP